MSTHSISYHDDRPRRRGPHAAHCTNPEHGGPCPRPSVRREEEELPREFSEDPGLPARKEIVDTYAKAATRGEPFRSTEPAVLSTIEKVLALHGPARRTVIMKIASDPLVGISGDLLSNTVTVTIRQTYYSDEDEG